MKLNGLLRVLALLGFFLPPSADSRPPDPPAVLPLGEFSLHRGGGAVPRPSPWMMIGALLQEEGSWRRRRSDEPPLSLDLTFHLLREVLEMARAEQLAQQAHSNRRMMDSFGK
ncbi:corticoliberin-1-like [Austrofundulus limnaeus]|uniref:Corticoliberin-1-like n=1 Tax=Austrofundulus limnaeus TaxID=52670 RepID=A0A2I4D1Y9_AUSLI|nr:PREDICTED: corticoliberin-1-like [Austrofundulus limnaeus]